MMWVRNRWTGRTIAAALCLSMLSTLLVPSGYDGGGVHFGSFERWVRAQLRVPVDDAVEAAISRAVDAEAETFDAFIAAFFEAYAEAAPGRSISQVFVDRDLSNDALISFLQRRYSQIAEEGVLPRLSLTTAVPTSSAVGHSGTHAATLAAAASPGASCASALPSLLARTVVIPFRVLSSAQSLGP